MFQDKKNKQLFLLLGIAFLIQPILFGQNEMHHGREEFFSAKALLGVFTNLLLIVFFILNYIYLIPFFYLKNKNIAYFFIVIITFLLITLIVTQTSDIVLHHHHHKPRHLHPNRGMKGEPAFIGKFLFELNRHFFLYISVTIFSLFIHLRKKFYENEKAKKEAEIYYLLYQINPHFLFNTLNSIYVLNIKENATQSSEAVLKLSEMMRFIITESKKDFVNLQDEIETCKKFIYLNKLRITSNTILNISIEGNFANKKITPLILIPFIENAFKYGVSPDVNTTIQISISIFENTLTLHVKNNIIKLGTLAVAQSGIGIENTQKRLAHSYPNQHSLNIHQDENIFEVNLKINV